jgi:hypothetical protein
VREVVEQANQPTVVEAERERLLASLPTRSFSMLEKDPEVEDQDGFPVEAWANGPWLSTKEVELLSIRKGSLSAGERKKIENHVTRPTSSSTSSPGRASCGACRRSPGRTTRSSTGTGYPRGLKAAQIPRQSRMMTISDIYDALVAWDRRTRSRVSEEQARAILCEEAQHGKIDAELLQVFLEAEITACRNSGIRLQKRT